MDLIDLLSHVNASTPKPVKLLTLNDGRDLQLHVSLHASVQVCVHEQFLWTFIPAGRS